MKHKKILALIFITTLTLLALDSATVQFYGKLHRKPSLDAPIITMVDHGNVVKVISEKGNWVEVQHNGFRGWLHKEHTTLPVVAETKTSTLAEVAVSTTPADNSFTILLISGSAVTVISMILLFMLVKRKKKTTLRHDMTVETEVIDHQKNAQFQVLIFSKKDKSVGSTLSNIHKRLSSCFRELGFNVLFSPELKKASLDLTATPNIIVIDARMERNYLTSIEKLFQKYQYAANIPVIIYNLETPAAADPGHFLEKPYFLGRSFTDQDIMRITGDVLKPVEEKTPDILSGIITGDGLYEIMQLIELSNKNGLLQILNTNNQLCGEIGFENGMIVVARTATEQGEQAAMKLAASKQGRFAFKLRQFRQRNCMVQPTAIMLNAMKIQDEQKSLTNNIGA